jgi:hypothetical protein|nr:MAG TPA: Pectate lyase [Caudoviricetes sp.]
MSNELINRQYVGARYVPKIMGEWNKALQYEALSVVTHVGNSFTSKIPVPSNIDIEDENYWVNTGNFNAQIAEYTSIAKENILCFATVTEMKQSKILKKNMKVKTLGYRQINDNGGAYYYITDIQPNAYYETLSGELYATLIFENELNIKALGAYGDGVNDDYNYIIKGIECLKTKGGTLFFPSGTYLINEPIIVNYFMTCITFKGENELYANRGTKLLYNGNSYMFEFSANLFHCNFENIYFCGNNRNNGILFKRGNDSHVSYVYFRKCWFTDFLKGTNIACKTGYLYFNNCTWYGSNDINFKYCVSIGTDETLETVTNTDNTEYVYFNDCNISGVYSNSGNGVVYNNGQFIYMTRCDINNWSTIAFLFNTNKPKLYNDIILDNMSFVLNKMGISIVGNGNIKNLKITGNFSSRDSDGMAFKCNLKEGYLYGLSLKIDKSEYPNRIKIIELNNCNSPFIRVSSYLNGFIYGVNNSNVDIQFQGVKYYGTVYVTSNNTSNVTLSEQSPYPSNYPLTLICYGGKGGQRNKISNTEFGPLTLTISEADNATSYYFILK